MRMKLLCATDLTGRSDHAMQRTAMLARAMNAQAVFVHAVGDSRAGRVVRMNVNRSRVRLLSQSERAMKHAPQDAETLVRLGKPLQAIVATAREFEPDLIVMAAPRRRRLDAVIGTTAERVIRSTGRPVLLVNGPAKESYGRVVLATDLSATSAHAAGTAANMGVLANAQAWIVHGFDPPPHGMLATDWRVEALIADHERRWRQRVNRELVRELEHADVALEGVQVIAEIARPLDAIEKVIQRIQPDLLVIGVSRWLIPKRMLLGSVADQVFRKIQCDVLAISRPRERRSWLRAA